MDRTNPVFRLRSLAALLLAAGLCAGFCRSLHAQQAKPTEDQVKAAYLYNFGRYVKWPPDSAHGGGFTICVLSDGTLAPTLTAAVAGQKLNGKAVLVRRLASPQEAAGCHILFVDSGESGRVRDLLAALDQSPVLTVSDMPGFLQQGGMIQFVLERDNIRFKVDLSNVSSARLTLSSELLKVAAAVQGTTQPGGE
jgi:hypothetical protein